jgi:hypothetical protein
MACCQHTVSPTATSIFESYASCLDLVYVRKTSFCKPNRDTHQHAVGQGQNLPRH